MNTDVEIQEIQLVLAYREVEELDDQLTGFWAADKWDMADCPLLPEGATIGHVSISFDCNSPSLNTELKYACRRKFEEGRWSLNGTCSSLARVRAVIRFLKEEAPDTESLLERDLSDWLSTFEAHLKAKSSWCDREATYIDKSQKVRKYRHLDARTSALSQLYQVVQDTRDMRPEHIKDIWDVRKMGAALSPADLSYRLNFTHISQSWLRQAAKHYIRYRLPLQAVSTCRWMINALDHFSAFLDQLPRQVQAADIDRALITEYLAYLATSQLGSKTRQNCLVHLRGFLETSAREGWGDFPRKRLIYDEDIPKRPSGVPRPIPEQVLEQLDQHLDALPEPYRTMVIILRECGVRISELCSLSLDCLSQDQDDDWFLRYFQWKMKKEHVIPITAELASVIRVQQQVVGNRWGDSCAVLFPNDKGNRLNKSLISRALNRLAYEKDIRDATGKLFRFRVHEFRHTVGTRMIRNGVKQHHVQRYLGHESPEMTMMYAEITDQDLKRAFAEYHQLTVGVTGKVIEEERAVDAADLQWFKKNIMAQALPNGFCALPALAEPCPFPNACLTCANFRTNATFLDVLERELEATGKLLSKARANNWTRQIEMNERVQGNLQRIITSLEVTDHEPSEKC
jgi:integrase/recombinase XerD